MLERYRKRDASKYSKEELTSGKKRLLGFVQGYSGDPFLTTLFNEAQLIIYRALAPRSEQAFCVDYTGHEVSDWKVSP